MLTLATRASGQVGEGTPLIRKKRAGSSPVWPTKEPIMLSSKQVQRNTAHGPLAQRQSGGLLTRDRPGFDSLMAHDKRRWRNGKRVCLLSGRSGFDSPAAC